MPLPENIAETVVRGMHRYGLFYGKHLVQSNIFEDGDKVNLESA